MNYRNKFCNTVEGANIYADMRKREGFTVTMREQANGTVWVYFHKDKPSKADSCREKMLGLLAAGEAVKATAMMIGFFGPSPDRNSQLSEAIGTWDIAKDGITAPQETI